MHAKRKADSLCPFLPPISFSKMSYRNLQIHKKDQQPEFAHTAAMYAHYLWLEAKYARAILALNRAIYSNATDLSIIDYYKAYAWMLMHYSGDEFLGNPRISFHHQAIRMKGANLRVNNTRAWALWYLTRKILPHLPPDQTTKEEPSLPQALAKKLNKNGRFEEGTRWFEIYTTPQKLYSNSFLIC